MKLAYAIAVITALIILAVLWREMPTYAKVIVAYMPPAAIGYCCFAVGRS